MLYLYQSPESGKYRFYNDANKSFSIFSFSDIAKGYHRFCGDIVNGFYQKLPSSILIASSPTLESFPDLYPEFFI